MTFNGKCIRTSWSHYHKQSLRKLNNILGVLHSHMVLSCTICKKNSQDDSVTKYNVQSYGTINEIQIKYLLVLFIVLYINYTLYV